VTAKTPGAEMRRAFPLWSLPRRAGVVATDKPRVVEDSFGRTCAVPGI
jgi:hypothetical protein